MPEVYTILPHQRIPSFDSKVLKITSLIIEKKIEKFSFFLMEIGMIMKSRERSLKEFVAEKTKPLDNQGVLRE